MLIFVRTDCPISNRYAPTIQRLSSQHTDKAVFWLVYPDKTESPEAIRKHERDFGYQLPALRDVQRNLVKQSRVQITPKPPYSTSSTGSFTMGASTISTRISAGLVARRRPTSSRTRFWPPFTADRRRQKAFRRWAATSPTCHDRDEDSDPGGILLLGIGVAAVARGGGGTTYG